jgi:hypothetical protein
LLELQSALVAQLPPTNANWQAPLVQTPEQQPPLLSQLCPTLAQTQQACPAGQAGLVPEVSQLLLQQSVETVHFDPFKIQAPHEPVDKQILPEQQPPLLSQLCPTLAQTQQACPAGQAGLVPVVSQLLLQQSLLSLQLAFSTAQAPQVPLLKQDSCALQQSCKLAQVAPVAAQTHLPATQLPLQPST